MRRSVILLLVGLALVPANAAARDQKQKKTDPTPLTPVQSTSAKIIPSGLIASASIVEVAGSDSAQRAPVKVAVFVHAERPPEAIGSENEVWLNIEYAPLVEGEKPNFPLSEYVTDTTGIQVTDGEQMQLERISLSSLVNQSLDAASSNKQIFIPSAPPAPPVGSPSTYYIDCSGGYYTNTVSCQATPDNNNASSTYAAQQAGYLMGTAIRAWRVQHHNQTIARQANRPGKHLCSTRVLTCAIG